MASFQRRRMGPGLRSRRHGRSCRAPRTVKAKMLAPPAGLFIRGFGTNVSATQLHHTKSPKPPRLALKMTWWKSCSVRVMSWYRTDLILPFVADARLPTDAVFLIIDPDTMFTPR